MTLRCVSELASGNSDVTSKTQTESPNMIHVIAKIKTARGKRSEFLEEFHKLVPSVLAEAGCVEYGPTTDAVTEIKSQQVAGDDVAVIIERWENLDALKAHLVADHMTAYRTRVKNLVENTTLEVYETA